MLDALKRVPGVGEASLFGALDYSMRIWLKLDRMSSLDITANDVVKAVQSQNVQAAVGLVGAAPLMDDGRLPAQHHHPGPPDRRRGVREHRRARPSDGSLVRIKDIARVELGAKTSDQSARYNGKPAAGIADLPAARRQCAGDRRRACAS